MPEFNDEGTEVEWTEEGDVSWASRSGLVIALVSEERSFGKALAIVQRELANVRQSAAGASGELILDADRDWILDPDTGAADFSGLAAQHNLVRDRIGLSLAEDESLESVGRRHFAEQELLVGWSMNMASSHQV